MQVSTDSDIVRTQLHTNWGVVSNRYSWAQIQAGSLGVPVGQTIVIIAHGSATEIGNATPGTVDLTASDLVDKIANNVVGDPGAIYISTCDHDIANFASYVRLEADKRGIWKNTSIFGHRDAMSGKVPPPNDVGWNEMMPKGTKRRP